MKSEINKLFKQGKLNAIGIANHEQRPIVFLFDDGQQWLSYYDHSSDDSDRHTAGNFNRVEIDLIGQTIPTTGNLAVENNSLLQELRAIGDDIPNIGDIEIDEIAPEVVAELFHQYSATTPV